MVTYSSHPNPGSRSLETNAKEGSERSRETNLAYIAWEYGPKPRPRPTIQFLRSSLSLARWARGVGRWRVLMAGGYLPDCGILYPASLLLRLPVLLDSALAQVKRDLLPSEDLVDLPLLEKVNGNRTLIRRHDVNMVVLNLIMLDLSFNTASSYDPDSPKDMFKLGASHTLEATHVEFFSDEDEPEVDLGNQS
ncbi:hypothetical protein Tco_0629144 [Tanacetum coccineum]|uniref:Uncharacterized protein n=1 Tax=Tanacetum coccineum TaxID=301880 RepID=A0ABQ4WSE6_9ASTR